MLRCVTLLIYYGILLDISISNDKLLYWGDLLDLSISDGILLYCGYSLYLSISHDMLLYCGILLDLSIFHDMLLYCGFLLDLSISHDIYIRDSVLIHNSITQLSENKSTWIANKFHRTSSVNLKKNDLCSANLYSWIRYNESYYRFDDDKNTEKHTAHTIVSSPNPRQW